MSSGQLMLNDRWYGPEARERLRQFALWSPEPVLLYLNCGLPIGDIDTLEQEAIQFQNEGIMRFWTYEGEREFPESVSRFKLKDPLQITDEKYQSVTEFVNVRLENLQDLDELGYKNMEGMLLEHVVLRRRFYTQAICGALSATALVDAKSEQERLYSRQLSLFDVAETLETFFEKTHVPSLMLLRMEGFLELRERAQQILPAIAEEVAVQFDAAEGRPEERQRQIVAKLMERYKRELLRLIRALPRSTGRAAAEDAFAKGNVSEMEARIAFFKLHSDFADYHDWFRQSSDGRAKLALFLTDWKTMGRG